jgi:hypothetical protein
MLAQLFIALLEVDNDRLSHPGHHGVQRIHDRAVARTVKQEMMPYSLNGHYHYPDCEAKLNTDPNCHCVGNMAKQCSVLAEECGRLMQVNRQLKKQLDNATNG